MKLHRPCKRNPSNPRMTIDDISDVYLHECVRMCVGRVVVIVVVLVSVCRVCMCLNVCVLVYERL